jgi:hypothetical protein
MARTIRSVVLIPACSFSYYHKTGQKFVAVDGLEYDHHIEVRYMAREPRRGRADGYMVALAEGELGVIGFVSRGSDGEWSFQPIWPMEERDNVYRDADRACMMQEGPKHALGTHFLRGICLGSAKSRKECLLRCGYELEVVAA